VSRRSVVTTGRAARRRRPRPSTRSRARQSGVALAFERDAVVTPVALDDVALASAAPSRGR